MSEFFGQAYMYKNSPLGVCPSDNGQYMIGVYLPWGSFKRFKSKDFTLYTNVEGAQKALDGFAKKYGLEPIS